MPDPKKDQGKFVGDRDEADAFVKALGRAGRVPSDGAAPSEPGGVGSVFIGPDGQPYKVVEEVVATGEDYQEGDDNTGTEEDA